MKTTRRYFLKSLGAMGTLSALPTLASRKPASHSTYSSTIKQLDDDFIIIDGWVLLRSDLDH